MTGVLLLRSLSQTRRRHRSPSLGFIRVCSLSSTSTTTPTLPLASRMTPESIEVIARSWYFRPMFPNLEHLCIWSSSLLPAFGSPNLKSTRIMPAAAHDTNISLLGAFSETAINCPSLTEIMIIPGEVNDSTFINHEDTQITCINAYTMCRTLVRVSLPLYYLCPCLLHILSTLPHLEIIDMVTKTSVSPTPEDG